MDKKIVCEFTKRELLCLERLLAYESTYYGDGDIRFDLRDRIAKIRRDNEPTINSTASWP